MVLNVILLEHHRKRHPNRQIRQNRKHPIRLDAPESKVVGNLMHGEEGVLVGGAADEPGEEPEFEAEEGSVAEEVGGRELDEGDEEDDVFCKRFVAHQLGDLCARRHSRPIMRRAR